MDAGVMVNDNFIVGFVAMEDQISNNDYLAANEILQSLIPQNAFDSNLVKEYNMLIATYYPFYNTYSYDQLQELQDIAASNVYKVGIAKYIAHTIVYNETTNDIQDPVTELEVMRGNAYLNSCSQNAKIDSISVRDLDLDSIFPIAGYDSITSTFNVEIVSWSELNPDHLYDFVAYSNGVAMNYGNQKRKEEWMQLSGDLDLFFVCDGNGKNVASEMEKGLKLYPNPVNDELTIEGINKTNCTIEIYNLQGALVLQQTLQIGLQKINLANMNKGLYLVRVKDAKGSTLKYTKLTIE